MSEVGIGLIGSGYMGRTFAECLRACCRGGRLRAVAGGTRAATTAAEFGLAVEPSVDALLARSDIDAIITSPHADHHDHVIAAAGARKHVFLEKPMEVSVARCDAMIAACAAAGVTLCVAHVARWRSSARRGKELIDRGEIGQVQMIHHPWRAVSPKTEVKRWTLDPLHGGVVLDAGVHVFDTMRWFAGAPARRVFGAVGKFSTTRAVKPTAMVQMQFANGVTGQFWLCVELPSPGFREQLQRIEVVGTAGLLAVDPYGKVEAATDGTWREVWEQPPLDYLGDYLNAPRLEAFAAELQDFLDSLRDGRKPFATGEDGRAAVEIVEAANRSSETGEAIALPL